MDDVDSIQTLIVGFPHPPGSGGPGSFQSRLQRALKRKGWRPVYLSETREKPDIVLVIGGTRRLLRLWSLRRQGVPIVYRLDGILWLHRKQWPGLGEYLAKELRNVLCKFIHAYLADFVVYQSGFVRDWWERCGWRRPGATTIIHNGVDLNEFFSSSISDDSGIEVLSRDLICVEGHIDYSPYSVDLINQLAQMLHGDGIKIRMHGGFAKQHNRLRLSDLVDYRGPVPRGDVQNVYRNGIYLSLDVNAACPNTVIEAMSCGIPVVGFDTGALHELVPRECGRIVDFGGNPWALDFPAVEPLHSAIMEVMDNYSWFSRNARRHAEQNYDIEHVTGRYIEIFQKMVGRKNEVC